MSSSGEQAMNFARLDDLGGPELARELAQIFVDDVASRLQHLDDAHSAHSSDALARVAHGVKGACGNIGAERMAALAELIEYAPAADCGETAQRIAELRSEFSRVRSLLAERLSL